MGGNDSNIGNLNGKNYKYKHNLCIKIYESNNRNSGDETIRIAAKKMSSSAFFHPDNSISTSTNLESITAIRQSMITCLLEALTREINTGSGITNPDSILSTDCCYRVINNLSASNPSVKFNDNELLLLYAKQFIIIFKNTDILNKENGFFLIKNFPLAYIQLYYKMFDSFWNKVNWPGLFPSMPKAASTLKINRNILINLILKEKSRFRIDRISNRFFKLTRLAKPFDLFFISFLDFYFFTWLSHFGIIKYFNSNDKDPVEIELTKLGRLIFKSLI